MRDVHLAPLPGVLEELEWALETASVAAGTAARTFEEHAFRVDGGALLRANQFYRDAYGTSQRQAAHAEWDGWCKRCYAWIYEATKAVNWLADVVRRYLTRSSPPKGSSLLSRTTQLTEEASSGSSTRKRSGRPSARGSFADSLTAKKLRDTSRSRKSSPKAEGQGKTFDEGSAAPPRGPGGGPRRREGPWMQELTAVS